MNIIDKDVYLASPAAARHPDSAGRLGENLAGRGISSAAVPRHHRRLRHSPRRSAGRIRREGQTWLLTTRCARSCRSPASPRSAPRAVEITGGADPVLPTPFRIGETGAAALAATGLAVSDLWELRTGRQQEVAVDLRQATASLRSGHYLQDGRRPRCRPSATRSWASIRRRTAAGAISTPISRTTAPPR